MPGGAATPVPVLQHQLEFDGLSIEHLQWQLPYGPPTEALLRSNDKILSVIPDTEQLLCLQAKKLLMVSDPGLISVDEMAQRKNGCFYRMPVANGRTLREYLSSGPVPVDVLLDVALTMERLAKEDSEFFRKSIAVAKPNLGPVEKGQGHHFINKFVLTFNV